VQTMIKQTVDQATGKQPVGCCFTKFFDFDFTAEASTVQRYIFLILPPTRHSLPKPKSPSRYVFYAQLSSLSTFKGQISISLPSLH